MWRHQLAYTSDTSCQLPHNSRLLTDQGHSQCPPAASPRAFGRAQKWGMPAGIMAQTESPKSAVTSLFRIFASRVGDACPDQMTELTAFDLPPIDSAALAAESAPNAPDATAMEMGHTTLRAVRQAEWASHSNHHDSEMASRYRLFATLSRPGQLRSWLTPLPKAVGRYTQSSTLHPKSFSVPKIPFPMAQTCASG